MNKFQIEECNYCKGQFNIDPSLHFKYAYCIVCNTKYAFQWGEKISLLIITKINNVKYELYINYRHNYTEITNLERYFKTIKIRYPLQINRSCNIEDKIKTILSFQ